MLDLIRQLGAWSWIIAGLILLALELLAPGVFLVWFGVAAVITGLIAFVTDFSWQTDLIIFVVLAVAAVVVGRRYFASASAPGEQPLLNQRARRHVGSIHVLAEPIVNGQGRIHIEGTPWRIEGPDLPSGTRVRVSAADGAVLTVERAG
jgi:membrane protein implicated in regulation of membrane protease activity